MLVAYLKVDVLSEKRIEFEQTVFSLQREFGKAAGCLNYNIYQDTERNTSYFLISEWQNQEVLESHFQTNSFYVLQGAINNLCEPPDVKFKIASLLDNSQSPVASNTGNGFMRDIINSGGMKVQL